MVSIRALAASLLLLAACGDTERFGAPGGVPNGRGGQGGAAPGPMPVSAGPILSEAPFSTFEAETHLAVAPDGRIFAVWIALGLGDQRSVGYAVSKDRGKTWSPPGVVPTTPGAAAVDPAVAADAQGTFHVVWLELATTGERRVMTTDYADEFDVFGIPVELTDPAAAQWDKPWITALDDGTLFVVWGTESGNALQIATSADGQAWTKSTFAFDGALRNVAFPCGAGGGRVYLAYLIPGGLEVARSDDAGATWGKPVRADLPDMPAAFEAPSCAAVGDEVWVVYGTSPDAGDKLHTPVLDRVVIAHSRDGGAAFPDHGVLGDELGGAAMLPMISRAPDGRLDIIHLRGKQAFDAQAALRWSWSSDGVAWSAPATLHLPIQLDPERGKFGWLGDYLGLRSEVGAVDFTFADNLGGPGLLSHVRFGRAAVE